MKEEKKKWVMPKFLPYKYDVKLINEDKVYIHLGILQLTFYLLVQLLFHFFPLKILLLTFHR